MSEGLDRRNFLVRAAAAGAGLLSAGWLASCTRSAITPASATPAALTPAAAVASGAVRQAAPVAGKSRVALYTNPNLMETPSRPNPEKVLAMLDRGMMSVFGTDSVEKAWRQVASPTDVVALKVNTIASQLSTSPMVSYAIAHRLMEIGVPAQNILIFDRTTGELQRAGYEIVKTGTDKPYCYGTDGDYSEAYTQGAFTGRLSNILVQKATVLINVPVLKDWGGIQVTLSLKNHFGTIDNPGAQHHDMAHTIPCISATDPVKTKTRLVVLDASRGCFQGGPGPGPGGMWTYNGLAVSKDPVALDWVGNRIINEKRVAMGLSLLNAGPDGFAKFLPVAAEMGLGKATEAEIDLVQEQLT